MTQASETFGIADLAARAGVTPRTIRYYVAEGLLPPPGGAGKQRTYTVEHLQRLQAIKRFKEAYLPLAEIQKRLAALSRADLEVLTVRPTTDSRDRLVDDISIVKPLSPPDPRESRTPESGWRPFLPASTHQLFATAASPFVPRTTEAPPDSSVWHRVILAPGVELQYQVTGDRARDLALERFIQSAKGVLANLPPPDDSHRSS